MVYKTVEKENPAMVEACRKVQKYGFYPNHRLKCSRIKRYLTDKEKKYFLENKEYHFYNCNICGWTTNEDHSTSGRRFDGFTYESFKIPISVDQKVFTIDYPKSPEYCCFGNEITSIKDPYVNFEHLCNLNEHMLDHSPKGKMCLLIEIRVTDHEPENVQDLLSSTLTGLDEVHTLFGIKTIHDYCEMFRADHALFFKRYDFLKVAEKFDDHSRLCKYNVQLLQQETDMFHRAWKTKVRKDFVSNLTKNRSICRKWILGNCNNKKRPSCCHASEKRS